MAAPGIGVGDIVMACQKIYDLCKKYRDSVDEFDEIADKSRSTAVVLQRIRVESRTRGNLVDRGGQGAWDQLEDNLKHLDKDSKKLKELVQKYAKIHDEGPGRRMLWALKESGNLAELRRRIGYHEQMLQMWYMTLVYGSLRRIEGGQDDLMKKLEGLDEAFTRMKSWPRSKTRAVRESVLNGDKKPLETELRRSGMDAEAVKATLNQTAAYVSAPPEEQDCIEDDVRDTLLSHYRSRSTETGSYLAEIHDHESRRSRPSRYPTYAEVPQFSPRYPDVGFTSGDRRPDRFEFQERERRRKATETLDYLEKREERLASGTKRYTHRNPGRADEEDRDKWRKSAEAVEKTKKEKAVSTERRGYERERRDDRKPSPRPRSIIIGDDDYFVGHGSKGRSVIPPPPPIGILKRSRSTSSRPQFPTVVYESVKETSSRNEDKRVPLFIEPAPRRRNKLPIRSGYPSIQEVGHGHEEIVIIPNDSRRDRERMRARHNSEAPPYRPTVAVYRSGVTSPRSPGGSALLEVPDRHEYRSHSKERDNGVVLESMKRVERVEPRPSVERWPSADRGKGRTIGSDEAAAVRRPSGDLGKGKARPVVEKEKEVTVARRLSHSRSPSQNIDRQPRVEDAVEDDEGDDARAEVVIHVTEEGSREQEAQPRRESRGRGERDTVSGRSSSTHSYTRTRRTSSAGSTDGTAGAGRIKLVDRMDRIDSMET